jgi:multidrug efflux pump
MNISAPAIARPVATTLLTLGVALAGMVAFGLLPVSPLPQVDFPTIFVSAGLPGASPETMAATVATPLERSLGRIAGISEMTSTSSLGSTNVVLQFDLSRDIDGAARDVQAAINAARGLLPTGMPNNPIYRKANPAEAPIMIIGLTSKTLTSPQVYDVASTVIAQKLAQVQGIGQVEVGGGSLPAVRVELNPHTLNKYGISLETVRATITSTNANRPKGAIESGDQHWQIYANDQATKASDYLPLIVSYANGAAVRLSDVAEVVDGEQDIRNAGYVNGERSISIVLTRQPNANILETVDRINAILPSIRASTTADVDMQVVMDRSPTIRASLRDVERTLLLSTALVILVVFLFLRNGRATLIPAVAVPVSLIGTFSIMYLCGFSVDNLSLMALTIATGFVVDDAVVVLENVSRHIEDGMKPMQAALRGAREVGFTVLSMSVSLVAVFLPILLMGGLVGRLFREFAATLAIAVMISLVVSLTTTPMMCAHLLRPVTERRPSRLAAWSDRVYGSMVRFYERTLQWALGHGRFVMFVLLGVVVLNVYLFVHIPKGFFPEQDNGRLMGAIQADQDTSFQSMQQKLVTFMDIIRTDPAIENVVGFTGGGQRNTARMFISLKPLGERHANMTQLMARLRIKTAHVAGANLFMQPVQDIRAGGRQGNSSYQYTLSADSLDDLRKWGELLRAALTHEPTVVDVDTDAQDRGQQTTLVFDRDTIARLGLTLTQIDSVLNDSFGQRQVSTIYKPLNQYHVVMELAPQYWQSPESLKDIYVTSPTGGAVPLSAFSHYERTNTPLRVNHQGQFASTTISFNLAPGVSLSDATIAIERVMASIGVPTSVRGSFEGTAKVFQQSLGSEPLLILTALLAVYIVLGMLYESYIHPLTILSTLPSAGLGALLALILFNTEFSLIALIGVILLIGIVKKNAIMMVDFALQAERDHDLSPRDAILQACLLRFRPIMMTTAAALLGAVPLALGVGNGAELRQPLGISIVGGLIVSQLLTLYTTPVVYLYLDRFRLKMEHRRKERAALVHAHET